MSEAFELSEQLPVAYRYDFDGYGYQYIDSGSGSDWQTRIKDAEPLYTKQLTNVEPIAYCVDLEEDALIEASKILCLDSTDENFLKIPLYTHPMRELTDEEIVKVLDDIVGDVQHIEVLHMIIFAKEILKASRGEK